MVGSIFAFPIHHMGSMQIPKQDLEKMKAIKPVKKILGFFFLFFFGFCFCICKPKIMELKICLPWDRRRKSVCQSCRARQQRARDSRAGRRRFELTNTWGSWWSKLRLPGQPSNRGVSARSTWRGGGDAAAVAACLTKFLRARRCCWNRGGHAGGTVRLLCLTRGAEPHHSVKNPWRKSTREFWEILGLIGSLREGEKEGMRLS